MFRKTSSKWQQNQQEGQGQTLGVMDAKWCQIPGCDSVDGAKEQYTATSSARDEHGANTEKNAGMMDQQEGGKPCNKTRHKNNQKRSQHKQEMEIES